MPDRTDLLMGLPMADDAGELVDALVSPELDNFPEYLADTADAISIIIDWANRLSRKELSVALYRAVSQNHRYLQNELVSSLIDFLNLYADAPYDQRNRLAVVDAKLLAGEIERSGASVLPHRKKQYADRPGEPDLESAWDTDICPSCQSELDWYETDFTEGVREITGLAQCTNDNCGMEYEAKLTSRLDRVFVRSKGVIDG